MKHESLNTESWYIAVNITAFRLRTVQLGALETRVSLLSLMLFCFVFQIRLAGMAGPKHKPLQRR